MWKARKERAAQAGADASVKKVVYEYDEQGRRKPIAKRPLDSLQSVELNFSSDAVLREQYENLFGGIRVGKILEDLDALAGSVAHAHADLPSGAEPPYSIVTASVDRIMLLDKLVLDRDIRFRGFVSYAGTSSMEVRIDMESKDPATKEYKPLVLANFTMVATQGGKAIPVNTVDAQTEEEKVLWNLGSENNKRRKEFAKQSLQQVPPTSEEVALVHKLHTDRLKSKLNAQKQALKQAELAAANAKNAHFSAADTASAAFSDINTPSKRSNDTVRGVDPLPHFEAAPSHVQLGRDPHEAVEMEHTRLQSIALCQPQERNTAGKVFGGFLMSKAQELAWSCANIYCGKDRAWFVALDHVSFQRPVEIGSIVVFDAQVIYTASKALCVRVTAEAVNVALGTSELCTTFHFTFTCINVPPVLPKSYEEVLCYIEGKRRFDVSQAFAQEWSSSVLQPHYGSQPTL